MRDNSAIPPHGRIPGEYVVEMAKPGDFGSRRNTPVDLIILHTTEGGSVRGALEWWDREEIVASAHYVLDGKRVVQRVAEGDAAFHCGNAAYNRRSIGIEVVGSARKRDTWSLPVMAQLSALCGAVALRHGISIDRHHVIGHAEVPCPRASCAGKWGGASHHTDPGPHLPWDDLFEAIWLAVGDSALPAARVPVPVPVAFGGGK